MYVSAAVSTRCQNSVSIQSIIERKSRPWRSIWVFCCSSRMRLKFSCPARFSAIYSRANSPDWISPSTSFMAVRVGSEMIRLPRV